MNEYLAIEIASNSLQAWLFSSIAVVITLSGLSLVCYISKKNFKKMAVNHASPIWDVLLNVVRRTNWIFTLVIALFVGSLLLQMPDSTRSVIHSVTIISLLLQAGLWASVALQVWIEQYRLQQLEQDPASLTTLNILNFIGKVVLWAIVLLLVLDNLGVNITALIAGLGVGGIAVALAVQTILSDLFASLSIVLDKPFVIGDFLIVGELLGSVEHVGLKTTRLRSLSGEQLVFSNSDLLNSRIRNYGRMYERRVAFDLGVTYQTSRENLIKIPMIIREAVSRQENARFDRSHFKEFGNMALVFESVYYVQGPDYNEYMDIQQAINLYIHEAFEREGIVFAYAKSAAIIGQS